MKIVVVGHTGFMGKTIFPALCDIYGDSVVGISTDDIDLTKNGSDSELALCMSTGCVVVMLAGVKKQLGDSLSSYCSNIAIAINFVKSLPIATPSRVIYMSSASVYGEDIARSVPIDEKTCPDPRTYYGVAKYTAELLIEKTCTDIQTEYVHLRPPLVYGVHDQTRGYGPTGFVFKASQYEKIDLWGDGTELREFVYVEDVGKIVCRIVENTYSGVVNLVSGVSYSYRDILDNLEFLIGRSITIKSRDRTKEKVDHRYDNALLSRVVGEYEFSSLKDGIQKMVASTVG